MAILKKEGGVFLDTTTIPLLSVQDFYEWLPEGFGPKYPDREYASWIYTMGNGAPDVNNRMFFENAVLVATPDSQIANAWEPVGKLAYGSQQDALDNFFRPLEQQDPLAFWR